MKFENLKANLKEEIKPAYIIGGEDSYLCYKALELVESACNITMPDFNKVIFNKEGFSAQDIVASCEVLPIMDERRLIVVKDYLGVKNDKEKEIIVNYLKNPVPTTCLVFFASATNNFYLSFVDKVEYIDCGKLTYNLLSRLVGANCSKEGVQMEVNACKKLIEYCNYNLTRIDQELNKLMAYKSNEKVIREKDVDEMVTKDEEYVIFELADALADKDGDKAYAIVDNLYYRKNNPTMILAFISNHFRRLFYSAVTDAASSSVATQLGVKEFAVIKARAQAKKFTKLKLKNIYDMCLECEYNIKSGKMQGETAISYLISNIIK